MALPCMQKKQIMPLNYDRRGGTLSVPLRGWFVALLLICIGLKSTLVASELSGEKKQWHKIMTSFKGPGTTESDTPILLEIIVWM